MKIRTRLTLRYAAVSAILFMAFALMVYFFSEINRRDEFYRDLKREGITKANLFLEKKVDAHTMQSIYLNNREFINEVEVAVYDTSFHLLYHDAKQIDLVKETPQMIERIIREKSIEFYQDNYQVVGLLYPYKGQEYVITAVAYDGYGYAKLEALKHILLFLWVMVLFILLIVGYYLAKRALMPVSDLIRQIGQITASKLHKRLVSPKEKDEIGELAAEFNAMLDKLEASFSSQKMFVSNVSHELRTPMAVLIGELEIASLRPRSEEAYKAVIESALGDAKHIVNLLDGLLNLAKAAYQPEQIKMEEVRLDELLLDACEIAMKSDSSYLVEIDFEQEFDDDTLITVVGNAYLLKTAFVNLLENNCKFSDNHTSQVQISANNKEAVIRFSDTGIGIADDDLPFIFDPFYRGKNKSFAKGNGIGMALVKRIVELHNGSIEVVSHPNEGTLFILRIPHIF